MDLRISVIIPVYNAERYVETAVRSALQFAEVKEVILVDDAGPDNSLAVCQRLAALEPRIKLMQHPGGANRGAGESRNLGMRVATEEFIAFLDADDHFLPNRFDAEHRIFAEHPDADGVYGAVGPVFEDAQSRERYERTYRHRITTVRHRVPPEDLFRGLLGFGPADFGHIHLNALTIRKRLLARMDALMTGMVLHEDSEFTIRLAWYGRLYPGSLEQPVSQRRLHPDNRYVRQLSDRSRYLFEKTLLDWMHREQVDPEIIAVRRSRMRLFAVSSARTRGTALYLAWKYRTEMRSIIFRENLFVRLAGKDTKVYHALYALAGLFWPKSAPCQA